MDDGIWERYWQLVDRRFRVASYLNEIETGCCESIPKCMYAAEGQSAREEIALLDRHIARLEPLLQTPDATVTKSALPIRWLGSHRQLADTAIRWLNEGIIEATNPVDAVKRMLSHFVDKNGRRIDFESVRENFRRRNKDGKGELLTTAVVANAAEGKSLK